jgi:hypothetical protein
MNLITTSLRLSALLVMVGTATLTYAQRGEMTTGKPSEFTNPTQGFPGFFDTNFAEKGSIVVEWPPLILPIIPTPSLAVDYGVSDTLTVGTNALVTTIPWLVGARGLSLKVRTLVAGSDTMQSAATLYAGYIGANNLSVSWQVFSSNNAWKLAPRHIVSAQALIMNLGLESGSKTSLDYTNLQASTLTLGGGYQFLISNSMAISTYFMAPVLTSLESDTVGASISAKLDARSGQLMWGMLRSSLDIHASSWVYSLGGMYVYGLTNTVLPWFSATKRW